jgi:hypothetical protein
VTRALLNFSVFECNIILKELTSGVNLWKEFVFLAHLSKHVTDKLEFSQEQRNVLSLKSPAVGIEPRATCSNYHLDYLIESEQASERSGIGGRLLSASYAIEICRSVQQAGRI